MGRQEEEAARADEWDRVFGSPEEVMSHDSYNPPDNQLGLSSTNPFEKPASPRPVPYLSFSDLYQHEVICLGCGIWGCF